MKSDKITVLQLINSFSIGGAEALALQIAKGLAASPFQHYVCSLFEQDDSIADKQFRDKLVMAGVECHTLGKQRFQADARVFQRLRKIVRELDVDVLHSHCISPDLHAAIATMGMSKPILVRTFHSTEYAYTKIHKLLDRIVGRRFTRSVSISAGVDTWAMRHGIANQCRKLIPNGVDLAALQSAPRMDRRCILPEVPQHIPLVLSVGRMDADEAKGFSFLIRAMAQLISESAEVHLLLIGDGAKRQEYENLSLELGIGSHVSFLGRRFDVPSIMKACDMFVLGSIREGFGLVVCEAAVCGLPVVATDIPGLNNVIDDNLNGMLVEPRNPSSLALAIKKMLAESSMAETLSANLKKKVFDQYSIERVVNDYANLYYDMMSQKDDNNAAIVDKRGT